MKTGILHLLLALSAFYSSLKAFLWSLDPREKIKLSIRKGNKKVLRKYGEIAKAIYSRQHLVRFNREFEYRTLSKFESFLFEGATVLDIGANIGLFSLFASEYVGDKGQVLAFEPGRKTYDVLVDNLQLNSCNNVDAFCCALSNTNAEGRLTKPKGRGDAYNYLETSDDKLENTGFEFEGTTLVRLDDFLEKRNINKVDLIKIDVEGAELLVLKGFEKMLINNCRPTIIFECHEPWTKRFNTNVFETLKFLSHFGYKLEQYEESQWIATV